MHTARTIVRHVQVASVAPLFVAGPDLDLGVDPSPNCGICVNANIQHCFDNNGCRTEYENM